MISPTVRDWVATLLPERLGEVVQFLSGQTPPAELPQWVRANGRRVAVAMLPNDLRAIMEGDPIAFIQGFAMGRLSVVNDARDLLPQKGWNHIPAFAGILALLKQSSPQQLKSGIYTWLVRSASAQPVPRLAFFRGYVVGLDFERYVEVCERRMYHAFETNKRPLNLYLYLWLHWRALEPLGKSERVFEACRRAFSAIDSEICTDGGPDAARRPSSLATSLPSKKAFRNMLERDGYPVRARKGRK